MPGMYSSPFNTSFSSFKGVFHYEASAWSDGFKTNHLKNHFLVCSKTKRTILKNRYTPPLSWNCTEKLWETHIILLHRFFIAGALSEGVFAPIILAAPVCHSVLLFCSASV